jgi:hypothetical protein
VSRTGDVYEAYRLSLEVRHDALKLDPSAGVQAASIAAHLAAQLPHIGPDSSGPVLLMYGERLLRAGQSGMTLPSPLRRAHKITPDIARVLSFAGLYALSVGGTMIEMCQDDSWRT